MRFIIFTIILLLNIPPMFAGETAHCDSQKHCRVWLRTFGNWTQGDTANDNLRFASYGLTLGVDQKIGRTWLVGLSAGMNETAVRFAHSPDKDDISAFHCGLFARKTFDRFFVDLEGNFGYNDHSLSSPKKAAQWVLNGEAGTWWNHGLGRVEPYVRFSHVYWDGNGNDTKDTLIAGVRYSWRTATALTTTVPRFYGGVVQELGNKSLFSVSSFGNTPTVFPVGDANVSETRLFLGGGFTTSMGRSLDVLFRYTAEMSSNDTSHTALLGINCNF
jgi:outer membrane autotransporter protein